VTSGTQLDRGDDVREDEGVTVERLRASGDGIARAVDSALLDSTVPVVEPRTGDAPVLAAVPRQSSNRVFKADLTPQDRRPDLEAISLRRVRWVQRYIRGLVLADALVAFFAASVALVVRFGVDAGYGPNAFYLPVTLLFPLAWTGVLALGRAYEARFIGDGTDEFRRVLDSAVRFLALLALSSYLLNWDFARGYAIVAIPLATLASLVVRAIGRRVERKAEKEGTATRRVLVIGTERSTAELIRRLRRHDDHPFLVVGALVDSAQGDTVEGVKIVGTSREAAQSLIDCGADTIAFGAWSTLSQAELRRLSWELEGTHVDILVSPNLTDVSGPRISVRPVAGLPLLHVEKPEFTGFRRVFKGLFDRGVAAVSLVLLSPLFLVLAIAVRLDSRGPAFFRQERVGRAGRTFTMLKFRSMSVDAEDRLEEIQQDNVHGDDGPMLKVVNDPRITRVGRFLRRTSLDELPQLVNVLLGQMSLVGPRPPLPREVAQYENHVQRRLLVKPGLTGLWQVSGRADLSWEDSVRLDLYYVENWSFLLDIAILVRTVRAVLASRGAY
jgi:exopolysaccharide biosynthesis polyprenyl glycosylphosphotransferase